MGTKHVCNEVISKRVFKIEDGTGRIMMRLDAGNSGNTGGNAALYYYLVAIACYIHKTKLSIDRTLAVSSFLTRHNFPRVCPQLVPITMRISILKLISSFAPNTVWSHILMGWVMSIATLH